MIFIFQIINKRYPALIYNNQKLKKEKEEDNMQLDKYRMTNEMRNVENNYQTISAR